MNPAEAKSMYCPNCKEEIVEHDLTAKGCVFCSSICDWCGEHDLNEDTHFVNCLVRKPGTDIYEPLLFCEDCYDSEFIEGNIKESILDQFESLKPE